MGTLDGHAAGMVAFWASLCAHTSTTDAWGKEGVSIPVCDEKIATDRRPVGSRTRAYSYSRLRFW